MPTTSAKFVKLSLKPSNSSPQVNASVLVLACCFIATSSLPLVVSSTFILWLLRYGNRVGLLIPSLVGELTFHTTGRVIVNGQTQYLQNTVLIFSEVLLLVRLDRQWFLLWRDSMEPECYWRLLLLLKKEP